VQALLVIDMQKDFLKDFNPKVITNTVNLMNKFRSEGVPVIHVITSYTSKTELPNWDRDEGLSYTIKGTPGIKEPAEIENKEEHYVEKKRPDAFYQTNLESLLKELGVDTVYISGVKSHWCVTSTIFGAYARDYKIRIVTDCITSRRPALEKELMSAFDRSPAIKVLTSDEINFSED